MLIEEAAQLDGQDVISELRKHFRLPADTVYLDGNSLGALPHAAAKAVQNAVLQQWGDDLIGSWNSHGWIDLPARVGSQIAPLIGAAPGQIICADSISVNLFKLLATALALRPDRSEILTLAGDFPTDSYMAQGLAELLGKERCCVRSVDADELRGALNENTAVLMLTQVNYRSGEVYDMRALTEAAHAAGALVLWDLAHSTGVLPLSLDELQIDMAVGCGYKYLNGGPGAPAFVYLNQRHHDVVEQPLSGWFGHRNAFEFSAHYEAGQGVSRYLAGTPPIISLVALQAALEVYEGQPIATLRAKSLALSDFFLDGLAELQLDRELRCLTPLEHQRRGSQVSLSHPSAWGISQALIDAGVIVDFRAPDVVRFGFAPLYNSFTDLAVALTTLADVLKERRYLDERYQTRPTVT